MNTAELTQLHTETLNEARLARTYANITRRAETLFTEGGYTLKMAWPGFYHVFGPQGQHYTILTTPANCDCAAFAEYHTCKHYQAVDLMLCDEAQAAEYDALHTDADDGAYARY